MRKITTSIALVFLGFLGYYPTAGQANQPPYVSAVPKFTFAGTLSEQEKQLKENLLMFRFAASRKKQAADRF